MKKLLLFVAVVTAFSFASCRKDYTCQCTTTYTNGSPTTTDNTYRFKTTKRRAQTICDTNESSSSYSTTTCVAVK